jgi:folate-binding Fe-S cluster repair protein YgfZ
LGFVVDLEPASELSAERLASLREEWAAFLDARGLRSREQLVGTQLRFEVESEASQATQNDRAAAEAWLAARAEPARWRVGDIQDLRPDS